MSLVVIREIVSGTVLGDDGRALDYSLATPIRHVHRAGP